MEHTLQQHMLLRRTFLCLWCCMCAVGNAYTANMLWLSATIDIRIVAAQGHPSETPLRCQFQPPIGSRGMCRSVSLGIRAMLPTHNTKSLSNGRQGPIWLCSAAPPPPPLLPSPRAANPASCPFTKYAKHGKETLPAQHGCQETHTTKHAPCIVGSIH